jgi:hypothetical protein
MVGLGSIRKFNSTDDDDGYVNLWTRLLGKLFYTFEGMSVLAPFDFTAKEVGCTINGYACTLFFGYHCG